jgi:hypothetical protein
MLSQLVTNTLAYCTKVLMTAAKKLFNREICFLFNEEGFLYKLFFAEKGKKEKMEEKQKKVFCFISFFL